MFTGYIKTLRSTYLGKQAQKLVFSLSNDFIFTNTIQKSVTPFGACAERIQRRGFSIRLVQGTPTEKRLLGTARFTWFDNRTRFNSRIHRTFSTSYTFIPKRIGENITCVSFHNILPVLLVFDWFTDI